MTLRVCRLCDNHYQPSVSTVCPHCVDDPKPTGRSIAWLLGLGLGVVACGYRDKDSSSRDTSDEKTDEPASEPTGEALYGVPTSD